MAQGRGEGARLVAASLPSPPSGRRRKTWAPQLGNRKGRGGISPHAAREGSPAPFPQAPLRNGSSINYKVEKRETEVWGGISSCLLRLPLSVHFLWFGPGSVHLGGGNTHTRLARIGGAVRRASSLTAVSGYTILWKGGKTAQPSEGSSSE